MQALFFRQDDVISRSTWVSFSVPETNGRSPGLCESDALFGLLEHFVVGCLEKDVFQVFFEFLFLPIAFDLLPVQLFGWSTPSFLFCVQGFVYIVRNVGVHPSSLRFCLFSTSCYLFCCGACCPHIRSGPYIDVDCLT